MAVGLAAEFASKGCNNGSAFPGIKADEVGAKATEEQCGSDSAYVNGITCIGGNNSAIDCHKGSNKGHYDYGLDIGLAKISGNREACQALQKIEFYESVNYSIADVNLDYGNGLGAKFIGQPSKRQAGKGQGAVDNLEPFYLAGSLLVGLSSAHGESPNQGADHGPEAKQGGAYRHLIQPKVQHKIKLYKHAGHENSHQQGAEAGYLADQVYGAVQRAGAVVLGNLRSGGVTKAGYSHYREVLQLVSRGKGSVHEGSKEAIHQ